MSNRPKKIKIMLADVGSNRDGDINFIADSLDVNEVREDVKRRYCEVINEMVKAGKTIEEKKKLYRKEMYRLAQSINNDEQIKKEDIERKFMDKLVQNFQHSRSYNLVTRFTGQWSYDEIAEIRIEGEHLTITDSKDGWKDLSDEKETKEAKEKISKAIARLKINNPKMWCLFKSLDKIYFVLSDGFEREKAVSISKSSYGSYDISARMCVWAINELSDKDLDEILKEKGIEISGMVRGHRVLQKARELYKAEFGKKWA